MLVKFTFKNYKSYLEEQTLSLEASGDESRRDNVEEVSTALLPQGGALVRSAAVFGTTASGKTNVLKALDYMKRVVLMSAGMVQIVRQNDPFAFRFESGSLDSHFDAEFIENNTYYRYGFVIRGKEIVKEWLFRRSERLTPLFKRDEYTLQIKGLSKNSAKLLSPSPFTLFITAASSLNLEISSEIQDVIRWFTHLMISFEPRREDLLCFEDKEEYITNALEILKKAECGISNMRLIHESSYIDMETSHTVFDRNGEALMEKKIRIFQDRGLLSDGTVKLICNLALIMKALDEGAVLFINDFDSLINDFLSSHIISLFSDRRSNPKGAQLVVTSKLSPLIDKIFRRDQIYFTTRDDLNQTHLVRLSSIPGVRKNESYEKKLLESTYLNQYKLV